MIRNVRRRVVEKRRRKGRRKEEGRGNQRARRSRRKKERRGEKISKSFLRLMEITSKYSGHEAHRPVSQPVWSND